MHDQPETLARLAAWVQENYPIIYAAALSMGIAGGSRLMLGGGSLRRIAIESVVCGLITLAASNGLALFGIPQEYAPFFGGIIGLIGAEGVRAGAKRLFERKVESV
ncbi:phage holin, lambda family [Stutzerimonas stutzeri]|nr:phage holin, lambda family [Stutzerimonas stutzeri]